jgi:hypothetical protein
MSTVYTSDVYSPWSRVYGLKVLAKPTFAPTAVPTLAPTQTGGAQGGSALSNQVAAQQTASNNSAMMTGIAVGLALIACALLGCFFYYRSNNKKEKENTAFDRWQEHYGGSQGAYDDRNSVGNNNAAAPGGFDDIYGSPSANEFSGGQDSMYGDRPDLGESPSAGAGGAAAAHSFAANAWANRQSSSAPGPMEQQELQDPQGMDSIYGASPVQNAGAPQMMVSASMTVPPAGVMNRPDMSPMAARPGMPSFAARPGMSPMASRPGMPSVRGTMSAGAPQVRGSMNAPVGGLRRPSAMTMGRPAAVAGAPRMSMSPAAAARSKFPMGAAAGSRQGRSPGQPSEDTDFRF